MACVDQYVEGVSFGDAIYWRMFHAMPETVHPVLFKPIRFEADVEARTASVSIPGIPTATGHPIKNPAAGQDHRVRIDIPNGIVH